MSVATLANLKRADDHRCENPCAATVLSRTPRPSRSSSTPLIDGCRPHGGTVASSRSTTRPRRWPAILPGLAQFTGYRKAWLRGDLLAGITVAAYLVPQVMAYAVVAGLPPVTGLWAIVGPLAIYPLLGSSRQLSVGPEASTAVMTAVMLAPLAIGDPTRYAALAATLALLVAGVCLLGWLARVGFLANLLSKPVLIGYLAGVALIMIAGQLGSLTGVPVHGSDFIDQLRSFAANAGHPHWSTLVLAGTALALLLALAKLAPRSPGPLLVMLAATGVVAVFSLRHKGIRLAGTIPAGLPTPGLSAIAGTDLPGLILPAIGIAIVGFSDNVLTARALADRHGQHIDPNAELLALAATNATAGLFRGWPVSNSVSRAVIGDALGSRTQLSSLTTLATVLATVAFARPLLAIFPTAALGAIVVYAALRLINLSELRRIAGFRRSELILALLTTAAVLGLDVLYGVLAAVGLSILDLLRKIARPHDGVLGYPPGIAGMHDIDDYPDASQLPGLIVYRYDAPLCFANAEDFRHRALAALAAASTPVRWMLLNAETITDIDITAADALRQLHTELRRRHITLAMARVKQELLDALTAAGITNEIGPTNIYPTLPTAVDAYQRQHIETPDAPPGDSDRPAGAAGQEGPAAKAQCP
ncbi:MAG: sulfate permease [Sciscionella sp.]|nr:sulfate permease [Sciscionella sp.]